MVLSVIPVLVCLFWSVTLALDMKTAGWKQLYRQPSLKIVDLVDRLGSNRSYVFQAINREMGISFNEYVNRLRADHAEKEIREHPDKTLYMIGEQSGFASSSSFYRNFKQFKGIAPKEFQQQVKEGITI